MSGGSVLVHWAGTRAEAMAGYIHLSDWSGDVIGMCTHQDGCPTRTNPESRVRVIDTTLLAPEAQEAPGSEEIRQHESMMEPLWRRYCEEEGGLRRHSRLDSDDDDY